MRKLVMGNWKMNGNRSQWKEWAAATAEGLTASQVDVVILPPACAWGTVGEVLQSSGKSSIFLGAQDVNEAASGGRTGDVSVSMAKEAGCAFALIGHPERRKFHGENGERISAKVDLAYGEGLAPIVCVGEDGAQKEAGKTFSVLDEQVLEGLNGAKRFKERTGQTPAELVVAYEPLWAVSSLAAKAVDVTPSDVTDVLTYLREQLKEAVTRGEIGGFKVLYGGSVTKENAPDFAKVSGLDGVLVGRASLTPSEFLPIVDVFGAA